MPKRPNAIAFAKNERTLVVADKFGDVYTLPLIERKDISSLKGTPTPAVPSRSATPAVVKPFQTQANDKTVHSKRNLQALENQKKQAQKEGSSTPKPGAKSGINPKKDPTGDFYHKLIMGHVSMLTDIVVGKVGTVDPKSGKTLFRESIITADRDEHIRVSRGMPQSHVVEHFLHGHKEFVSRIHIPERYPNILISGGGDSYIYVWDYVKKELLSKQDMRSQVVKNDFDHDTAYESLLAVSGIVSYYDNAIGQTRVFVICEKYVLTLDLLSMSQANRNPQHPQAVQFQHRRLAGSSYRQRHPPQLHHRTHRAQTPSRQSPRPRHLFHRWLPGYRRVLRPPRRRHGRLSQL